MGGEYGVESSKCRLLCCFLFMMAVAKDAFQIFEMFRLLYYVPTVPQPWVVYDEEPAARNQSSEPNRMLYVENVRLKIAGIPWHWKLFYIVFVVCPKVLLWKMTAQLGILFLMDTTGIADAIVNSMALAFILDIDELIFSVATTNQTKYMMDKLEPFHLHKIAEEMEDTQEHILQADADERRCWWWCPYLIPSKLLFVALLTCAFLFEYYNTKCDVSQDGTWVSKSMRLPKSLRYTFGSAFFPNFFPPEEEEGFYWTMPPDLPPD